MSNDGQRRQGGYSNPPSSSSSSSSPSSAGRSNGFLPSSLRAISSYLKIVSSGASTVASTVRSASANVASSVSDRERDSKRDQVQWAGFDKLECEGVVRRVLLLCYRSGFQVWDVEEGDDVRELVSRHDGPVSFLQVQPKLVQSKRLDDKFSDVRPLLVVAGGGVLYNSNSVEEVFYSTSNENVNNSHEVEDRSYVPTFVRFYSLKSHSYVHVLKFRTAVYSIRCSPRVVAISLAAQIHCLNAATLEKEFNILTHPIASGIPGSGGRGYGPLAVGSRWLAYSGSPVAIFDSGRVSPQRLSRATTFTSSNGSLVTHYAKESSKQLAAGMITLGDIGYRKLSRYYTELLPDGNHAMKVSNSNLNGTVNGHFADSETVGTVIVRDVISKSVVAQFRAHSRPISALCFDPSGTLLVTASIQGHNINIFLIKPFPVSTSSEFDVNKSYMHLYRLQRGLTNAVIQDISFSDDSQWIMISSCRGTSHLFSLSSSSCNLNKPKNGYGTITSNNGLNCVNKSSVHWLPTTNLSKANGIRNSASGFPVTLSVVSRIKNGTYGWRGTVSGAAAAATGRIDPISGAIASAFHNCKGNDVHSNGIHLGTRRHLLVFSPLGSLIQYVLNMPSGADVENIVTGLKNASCASTQENDMRLIVEAIQKWDICQKKNRREREDNADIYGENGNADNSGLFVKGLKNDLSVHPTDTDTFPDVNQSIEERQHLYISEVELEMYPARVPLWARSEIYFQKMVMDDFNTTEGASHGEMEIEKLSTRSVEVRPTDLMPVSDAIPSPRVQHLSVASADCNGIEPMLRQSSGGEDAKSVPCESTCTYSDFVSGGASVVDETLTDLTEGTVNNAKGRLKLTTEIKFVNSKTSPKMESHLQFVNNKNCQKMGVPFQNGYLSD